MADQTTCPHCGADMIAKTLYRSVYQCGSKDTPDKFEQSTVCEVWALRAKVAELQKQHDHWKTAYEELVKAVKSEPNEMQQVLSDIGHGWHFCPEWDYMWIGPGCPEMEACCCDAKKLEEAK